MLVYESFAKQICFKPITRAFYYSSMKTSLSKKTRIFKFISEAAIRKDYIDLSPWQLLELRAKLPRSIYWVQPSERGKLHWNIDLLQDYLVNGDRPEHQALVEEYIATLPKTA